MVPAVCLISAQAQSNKPPSAPAPVPPAQAPVAPPNLAPPPNTTVPVNPVSPQLAAWIDDAITRLHEAQLAGPDAMQRLAANHPRVAWAVLLRGLIGLIGFPIHTVLEKYLLKNKVTPDKTAPVSVFWQQIDWLVNLVTSLKPSTLVAAAKITTVAAKPAA